jgi:hypothetical protein
MRRLLVGAGAVCWVGGLVGCGNDDPAPGSKIGQSQGSSGTGGAAGSLSLGTDGGGAGGGGAGGGGAGAGGVGGAAVGGAQAGYAAGGMGAQAGSSSGGSGGSKPVGSCQRAASSDADCADFYEDKPQAYACDDVSAASQLNQMYGAQCASVSFVQGAKYGECCPP